MVWAMAMSGGFGEFFPSGDYVGWEEHLHQYFMERMPAEQKAALGGSADYMIFVGEKFRSELGRKYYLDKPATTKIQSHEPPECFKSKKRYDSLGSIIKLTNRLISFDETLKAIIEKLEPGKHQFFPIKIIMPKGEVYPKQYYTIAVGQYLESLSVTESKQEVLQKDGDSGHHFVTFTKPNISGVALSKAKFAQAHLWRERYVKGGLLFLSDVLQAEIAKAGLRVPKHFQVLEV
jgi:hypothetical protein